MNRFNFLARLKKLSKKQKALIRRVLAYIGTVLAIIVALMIVTSIMLGFRFDFGDGQIEQYGFLQFNSTPSGATVLVDGTLVSAKTPNKISVVPGTHKITMKKTGYRIWNKTVDIGSGALKWLNYTLFVPEKLSIDSVGLYPEVFGSLPSLTHRSILLQQKAESPVFDMVDISSDTVKTTSITIPSTLYSDALTIGVSHTFAMQNWDNASRYVIIKHTYGDKSEWLMLDTQNVNLSKNISQTFDIAIDKIDFAGTSGNKFFVISAGDIRKLDLSVETISRVLANNVSDFDVYESNIVIYVAKEALNSDNQTIGLYRDGDDNSYTIKTFANSVGQKILVTTTHYFNEDYVMYSVGRDVAILAGSYPSGAAESTTSLKTIQSFSTDSDIASIGFSPSKQFGLVRTATIYLSYDLEYQLLASSQTGSSCANNPKSLDWLDESYIWSTCGDSLTIQDYDGVNISTIGSAVNSQAVVLAHSGKYIYYIGKVDAGYQLQRVKMIAQ